MNYKLTTTSSIICMDTGAWIPSDPSNVDYQSFLVWEQAGNIPIPADLPTLPQIIQSLEQTVQQWLDQTAMSNGYASMDSCVSYINSSVTQWSDDAKSAMAWRDAVWQQCFTLQSNTTLQTNPPTSAQLIAMLPHPSTYGWVQHAPGA